MTNTAAIKWTKTFEFFATGGQCHVLHHNGYRVLKTCYIVKGTPGWSFQINGETFSGFATMAAAKDAALTHSHSEAE